MEMYYTDHDLRLADDQGRRIFLREEFNSKGFSSDGKFKMENSKSQKLVVEDTIFEWSTQKSVGLTKAAFADNIANKNPPFQNIDFEPFREIVEVFDAIVKADSQFSP